MRFSQKQRLRLKKRPPNDSSSSLPVSAQSSKALLALISLLLLPYSSNTHALSATTANAIQGTAPYLTFDNGTTKVTTTDGLLSITLSDTTTSPTTNTTITRTSNISTATNPYILPVAGQTFVDVGMLVPPAVNTISLNAIIGAPYNYWGDDDGDGQGVGGVSATGNLSVVITDKYNQAVNRSDVLNICNAPYKVVLTSTAGTLSTQYGIPKGTSFTASNATYYISPPSAPVVCFAQPNMAYGAGIYAGPINIWNTTKGFIVQSTTSSTYNSNFPTTGANGLYFDLDIIGSATALSWGLPITINGITATMTASTPTSVRVTLTGPTAAIPPTPFATTGSMFELEGKSGSTTMVKYGFTIQKWYVNSGSKMAQASLQGTWCAGMGYRQSKVNDLTNAAGSAANMGGVIPGAIPSSGGNHFSRYIGTGLFSEWGHMVNYNGAGFADYSYWTSDIYDNKTQFAAHTTQGGVSRSPNSNSTFGVCTYP